MIRGTYAQAPEGFIEAPALVVAAKVTAENQAQSLIGRQIGSFKVLSLLGAGGMGEVYLAQDCRLDRTIALKILPTEFASDPDRMRRFVREAMDRVLHGQPEAIARFNYNVPVEVERVARNVWRRIGRDGTSPHAIF
jgi:hypothetical protein